jgi:hypothetical protein
MKKRACAPTANSPYRGLQQPLARPTDYEEILADHRPGSWQNAERCGSGHFRSLAILLMTDGKNEYVDEKLIQ